MCFKENIMKDKRVKWIDSRWGQGFRLFSSFIIVYLLCGILFSLIAPDLMFKSFPTILGFDMTMYAVMLIPTSLFGLLLGLLFSLDGGKYRQYTMMKKPFLIPYGSEDGKEWFNIFVINDSGKIRYKYHEWKENNPFYEELFLETKSKDNDFLKFSSLKTNFYYFIDKKYVEEIFPNLTGYTLKGYFIVERIYNRYQTLYPIKYLGKDLPNGNKNMD
jgi:hypothetical protein